MRLCKPAVLALVFAGSDIANAQQQLSWQNYCTLGSLQACASVELQLTPNGTTNTAFAIRMRNLEGTYGMTPWGMYNVGFFGLQSSVDWDQSGGVWNPVTYSGTGQAISTRDPNSDYCLTFGCPNPGWNQQEWASLATGGVGSTYWTIGFPFVDAIVGCDQVPQEAGPQPVSGYFQTCGDGWVNVSFSLPGTWAFDDQSTVAMNGWTSDGSTFRCTFEVDCTVATPEPGTIVLVGTGLVGLVMRHRRRRASSSRALTAEA